MTEIITRFDTALREAAAGLRQEAADMAQFPEMVDGLLQLVYDEDDSVRYDAAQMLTLLPEATANYSAVRQAIVTAFAREQEPQIRLLLARKLDAFAAGGDHRALLALQQAAESDESVAVQRWCLSGLAWVHPDFIPEAKRLLQSLRATRPDFQRDIDASLSRLTHRRSAQASSPEPSAVGRREVWERWIDELLRRRNPQASVGFGTLDPLQAPIRVDVGELHCALSPQSRQAYNLYVSVESADYAGRMLIIKDENADGAYPALLGCMVLKHSDLMKGWSEGTLHCAGQMPRSPALRISVVYQARDREKHMEFLQSYFEQIVRTSAHEDVHVWEDWLTGATQRQDKRHEA
jgi:hypothetical protein